MSILLCVAAGHVELSGPASLGLLRRPWAAGDREKLADYAKRYAQLVRPGDETGLLVLGRELYRWLDGEQGWLGQLRPTVTSGFGFEVPGPARLRMTMPTAWALLMALWGAVGRRAGLSRRGRAVGLRAGAAAWASRRDGAGSETGTD